MILYWSPNSPFVRKVDIALLELGCDGDVRRVRAKVAMDCPNPDLMRANPLSRLPTMCLDDGTVLTGSGLICRFLDARAGGGRLVPNGANAWPVEARHTLVDAMIETIVLARNERDKPAAQQRPQWVAAFRTKINTALDNLAQEIDRFCKDPMRLDTITLGCALAYLDYRMPEWDWRCGRQGLAQFLSRVEQTPSFRATVPGRQAPPA